MKNLCFSNLCWDFNEDKALKFLSQNEVENVEISPCKSFGAWENITGQNLLNYKNKLSKMNFKICSLQSIFFKKNINIFLNTNSFIDHFKRVVEISEKLECNYIVFGSPKTRNMFNLEEERCLDIFKKAFQEISLFNKDILIGIEPNPSYYGCNFLNNYDKIAKILNTFENNVCFHFDYACIDLSNDSPEEIFDIECRNLKHLHVSNVDLSKISISKKQSKFLENINNNKHIMFSIEMLNLMEQDFQKEVKEIIGSIKNG